MQGLPEWPYSHAVCRPSRPKHLPTPPAIYHQILTWVGSLAPRTFKAIWAMKACSLITLAGRGWPAVGLRLLATACIEETFLFPFTSCVGERLLPCWQSEEECCWCSGLGLTASVPVPLKSMSMWLATFRAWQMQGMLSLAWGQLMDLYTRKKLNVSYQCLQGDYFNGSLNKPFM